MNNYKINNINDKLKLPFELFSIDVIKSRLEELKKEDKKFALRYMGRKKLSVNEAVWEIIRLAQSSVADTCIIPIQDYLCLGNEARINHPSTLGGNWIWRLHRDEISKKLVKKIRRMTELYCRIPEKTEMLLKAEDAEDLGEEKK